MRLLEARGEDGAAELEAALLASGGPLAPLDAAGRRAVVERLEREQAQLFTLARNAAYVAYYESPAVVRAVAGLGQPYRAMPGKDGYPHGRRSISSATGRRHGRGGYIRTDEVQPSRSEPAARRREWPRVRSPPTS